MEVQPLLQPETSLTILRRLSPDHLRWRVDPDSLSFESTLELERAPVSYCQPRAEKALTVGIQMKNSGHIFVCGPPGTHRKELIEAILRQEAKRSGNPRDCLCICSFDEPFRPSWILLPPGRGRAFQTAVEEMVQAAQDRVLELCADRPSGNEDRPEEGISLSCSQELVHWLDPRIRELKESYGQAEIVRYLDALRDSLLRELERFLDCKLRLDSRGQPGSGPGDVQGEPDLSLFYRPQLLLESEANGVPIVFEQNPTLWNLFGYSIRSADPGHPFHYGPVRFQAGSLLRANGGFLILDFEEVAREPGVWKHLKRCLGYNLLEFPMAEQAAGSDGFFPRPDPIPIQLKLIAWGDEALFQDFSERDPHFNKIFKIRADLDSQIARSEEHIRAYLNFIRECCEKESLPHFHRSGAAAFLEAGAELAGRQNKLSAHWEELADLVRESAYWAQEEGSRWVLDRHVEKSLRESRYRRNLPEEQIQQFIDEGSILIQTDGAVTGQVNGMTLYDLEDYSFGKPCRITVQTAIGRSGVINIEREANLSGKIHDKGVLILCGFLRDRYAQDKPLNLSASLCIEQCYTDVDGDSASLGEVCGLLSSLAGVPVQQGIAVTGAISQRGEVQPVGGVNEKIMGFFQLCQRRGLIGQQGVIIPLANVQDLMLRRDLIEAVQEGKFHLCAVQTVDEAMEILSGLPAGQRRSDGTFPPGTLNRLIDDRLWHLSRALRDFYGEGGEFEEEESLLPQEPE